MRWPVLRLAGFGVFLLSFSICIAQDPNQGGFGGGGRGFGGGGPGGGGFGGGKGGKGGMRDPGAMFDRLANGKTTISPADVDPRMQGMFTSMGITGPVTRDQFMGLMQQRMASRMNGGPGGVPAPAAAPDPFSPENIAARAAQEFANLDKNGDGLLNNDEMSDTLRAERDKWDSNHDGFIDLNEFKAYYTARIQQTKDELSQGNGSGSDDSASKQQEEDKRPVVYRAGKLPKNIPAWFAELDTNNDAQVALYEWKVSGRPLEEFQKMDRNSDGFLTVEEVLKYQEKNGVQVASSGSGGGGGNTFTAPDSAGGSGGSTNAFDRKSNFNGGGPGFSGGGGGKSKKGRNGDQGGGGKSKKGQGGGDFPQKGGGKRGGGKTPGGSGDGKEAFPFPAE